MARQPARGLIVPAGDEHDPSVAAPGPAEPTLTITYADGEYITIHDPDGLQADYWRHETAEPHGPHSITTAGVTAITGTFCWERPEPPSPMIAVTGTSPVELAHAFASVWHAEHSYTPGRGWFHRQPGKLWTADDEALVVRERTSRVVAAHAGAEKSSSLKAIRTRTVVTEMEPLLSYVGGWDTDAAVVGLPDDTTMDMAAGKVRAATAGDRITRRLGAVPDFTREPAAWLKTLKHTCHNAIELEWLRLWCGLCLTGHTRDARFVFLQGPGGSGKGIVMRTVVDVAGSYHVGLPNHAFVGNGGRHPEWIARLAGARLATVADMPRGTWQSVDLLKSLVGGDPVTANFMRMGSFSFESTTKVMLGGNHQPALGYSDSGFARRITLIPAEKVADPDPHLRQTLLEELPAITGWMARAAHDYLHSDGLPAAPERWSTATTDYLDTDDQVGRWFRERCRHDPHAHTLVSELVADYNRFTGEKMQRATPIYQWLGQYPQQGVARGRLSVGPVLHGVILTDDTNPTDP